jgi:hypothetical protein
VTFCYINKLKYTPKIQFFNAASDLRPMLVAVQQWRCKWVWLYFLISRNKYVIYPTRELVLYMYSLCTRLDSLSDDQLTVGRFTIADSNPFGRRNSNPRPECAGPVLLRLRVQPSYNRPTDCLYFRMNKRVSFRSSRASRGSYASPGFVSVFSAHKCGDILGVPSLAGLRVVCSPQCPDQHRGPSSLQPSVPPI